MAQRNANQAQFLFACGSLNSETVQVVSFSGKDTISRLYEFSITVRSQKNDIAAEDVLGKQATLFFYRNQEYCRYSGIVMEFVYETTTIDYSTYQLTLVPKLKELDYNVQSKVFQKAKVNDIIKKVLTEAGLSSYFEMDLQGKYPTQEMVIQYQESDLNFISRLMEEVGIFYFFKEDPCSAGEADSPNTEKMVISDKPNSFKKIEGESELVYRTISGLNPLNEQGEYKESVTILRSQQRIVPASVFVKNYNYRTPEVDISSKQNVTAGVKGKVYKYGGEFKKVDEAETEAKVAAGRFSSTQADFSGKSDCCGLRAGFKFSLIDHVRDECNDTYVVREVIHTGSHANMIGNHSGSGSYFNTFVVLPSDLAEKFKPPLVATVPKINGILTATIETIGEDYASLDETGRYKVRLPFDISESENYDASKYVRLAQPYSGADYGMHFPSHAGAEMIIACVEGNPNKMMGIGTIPNANTISPVVSKNQVQSVIRTAGKNEVVMDDTKGTEKFSIYTPYDYSETADHDHSIDIKNDRVKTVGHDETNYVKNDRTITVDGKHKETIQHDTSINITQGRYAHDVEVADATYHVGGTLEYTVDGEVKEEYGKTHETTVQENITIKSVGSSIEISAAKQIVLKTGASSLLLKSDGTIELNGVDIKINGSTMSIDGKISNTITGGIITTEAKTIASIKAVSLTTQGSGTHTILGGMVVIN